MKYQKLILIILLSCCSGPSYLFIKVGVKTIPPMTLVFFRVFIAALTLFTLLKLQRKKLWSYRKHAKHFFVLDGALAHFTLPNDRLSVQKKIGILLGIIGLAFVLAPSLEQSYGDTQGTLIVILASVGYGFWFLGKHFDLECLRGWSFDFIRSWNCNSAHQTEKNL